MVNYAPASRSNASGPYTDPKFEYTTSQKPSKKKADNDVDGVSVNSNELRKSEGRQEKRAITDNPKDENLYNLVAIPLEKEHKKEREEVFNRQRSRSSRGFLLSNPIFDHNPRNRNYLREKAKTNKYEESSTNRNSIEGIKNENNPLNIPKGSSSGANIKSQENTPIVEPRSVISKSKPSGKNISNFLDEESTQVVNLALNLSENRRNMSKWAAPQNTIPNSISELSAGVNLRPRIYSQRNISGNQPSKNERIDTISTISNLHNTKIGNPLLAAFDFNENRAYQYHFSSSTLARADKARSTIELMTQYRKLLQFLPPLSIEAPRRSSSIVSDFSSVLMHPTLLNTSDQTIKLGRPYNPLQYIRNRKLRARLSRSIDGEAQGFGDIKKVSAWVEDVVKAVCSAGAQKYDQTAILEFPGIDASSKTISENSSPRPRSGKKQGTSTRVKRPRIDWALNPADLIADLYWLEQEGNRNLIEDRNGKLIFPKRMVTQNKISLDHHRQGSRDKNHAQSTPTQKETQFGQEIDPQQTIFKPSESSSENNIDDSLSEANRKPPSIPNNARAKLSSDYESRSSPRTQIIYSQAQSSDLEHQLEAQRYRSGNISEYISGTEVMEKKESMQKRIRRESGCENGKYVQQFRPQILSQNPDLSQELDSYVSQEEEAVSKSSLLTHTSFEGNDLISRQSIEWWDSTPESTTPNSPKIKNFEPKGSRESMTPSIRIDLLTPTNSPKWNPTSWSRKNLKIRPQNIQNIQNIYGRQADEEKDINTPLSISLSRKVMSPTTNKPRERSASPEKLKASSENEKPGRLVVSSKKFRGENERFSGIREFLKSPRNPLTKVSDFWKKESTSWNLSGLVTDDLDSDDMLGHGPKTEESVQAYIEQIEGKSLRENSADAVLERGKLSWSSSFPTKTNALPIATLELRGRPTQSKGNSWLKSNSRQPRQTQVEKDYIEVSPSSSSFEGARTCSFDTAALERRESRFGSIATSKADARLNAIIGGHNPNDRIMTCRLPLVDLHSERELRQLYACDYAKNSEQGTLTKKDIARIRILLLSSGIKAREIQRRAELSQEISVAKELLPRNRLAGWSHIPQEASAIQQHQVAAKLLFDDIHYSTRTWHSTSERFTQVSVHHLMSRVQTMQIRLMKILTPLTRTTADEADAVSKDLVMDYSLTVTRVAGKIARTMQRRRARFRWLKRSGWVIVEWALIGVMWWVWFIVMIVRIFFGISRGVLGGIKWLFWL
ncbi:BgTH12-00345 [Blumeria graminis f. sp. triticale]|uniref:Bgt-654 n=3 Tax=Blumeria graminis TaxID=34373 RepID=A0A381LGL1_BLUGR|nr:hypothetical protein BGT96224_654 [Blumeria graminis f. sp. tritici 96224]CAD6504843.1 BgTH12-00345 [Blumeria graminis f. sp. triticale]VDB92870.1 Bgt-654 [Blumeria graminis f. sp. tritici]